jgi:hypothetical protein
VQPNKRANFKFTVLMKTPLTQALKGQLINKHLATSLVAAQGQWWRQGLPQLQRCLPLWIVRCCVNQAMQNAVCSQVHAAPQVLSMWRKS